VDVTQKLDEIVAAVRNAKSMPMSASCVIHRADLLARLDEVRQALPGSLAQAREVLGDREQVVAEAQAEARRVVEAAHAERASLVENTGIVQEARAEAARILAQAREEAAGIRAEADDYVDSKLANFEVVLGKTIGSVDRGREKLLGPGRGEPQELLAQADAYVEAQFGAIEAVLRKTLEAVGRGRQKLTGHRPIDELAEHVAAQEARDAAAGQAPAAGYDASHGEQDTYGYLGLPQPGYDEAAAADPYAPAQPASQPVPAAGGYPADAYGQPAYAAADQGGYDPAYDAGPAGYGTPQLPAVPGQGSGWDAGTPEGYGSGGWQGGPGVLEETSLFDTGMIDAEQLRRYREGHA
jgi:cell division septum initiation protein DivIVA